MASGIFPIFLSLFSPPGQWLHKIDEECVEDRIVEPGASFKVADANILPMQRMFEELGVRVMNNAVGSCILPKQNTFVERSFQSMLELGGLEYQNQKVESERNWAGDVVQYRRKRVSVDQVAQLSGSQPHRASSSASFK